VAERRHTWDERQQGCCKKPNVWDFDPVKHRCATVPDLAKLEEPPARLRLDHKQNRTHVTWPRGCPDAELTTNKPAFRSVSC